MRFCWKYLLICIRKAGATGNKLVRLGPSRFKPKMKTSELANNFAWAQSGLQNDKNAIRMFCLKRCPQGMKMPMTSLLAISNHTWHLLDRIVTWVSKRRCCTSMRTSVCFETSSHFIFANTHEVIIPIFHSRHIPKSRAKACPCFKPKCQQIQICVLESEAIELSRHSVFPRPYQCEIPDVYLWSLESRTRSL